MCYFYTEEGKNFFLLKSANRYAATSWDNSAFSIPKILRSAIPQIENWQFFFFLKYCSILSQNSQTVLKLFLLKQFVSLYKFELKQHYMLYLYVFADLRIAEVLSPQKSLGPQIAIQQVINSQSTKKNESKSGKCHSLEKLTIF